MIGSCTLIALLGLGVFEPSDLEQRVAERVEDLRDELVALRRDLHRHPEVSGREERTARVVAERLEAVGLDVRRGVGGHGVVALLTGARPGPVVAFRADMDAVPSTAPDPVPFASEVPGVRHICGHDVHTTIGVALAEALTSIRDELPGSVLFVFQPAEESATGARAMIADGALDEPRPEAIFAFHTSPFDTGRVATARGVMMPGRDRITVSIRGAADAADRIRIERIIGNLTTVSSPTERQPMGSDFVFARARVLETRSAVTGFVTTASRAASARARRELAEAIRQLDDELPEAALSLDYEERAIAGVTNDPELTALAAASAGRVVGDDGVVWLEGVTPAFSEDFGSFQAEVPGVMFFLGVSRDGMPHTPGYVADEEAIFVGARVMSAVVIDYLERARAR